MTFSELKESLFNKPKVFIVTHKNPDGDAMGSSLGLSNFLKKIGAEPTVIAPTEYPVFLNWMEGNEEVLTWGKDDDAIKKLADETDLIFCLDFNALHRIDEVGKLVEGSSAKIVLIDHHQQPDDFADYMISDITACSTAQLIFEFIVDLGGEDKLDKGIAEALYCGIMTDTGSFRFPSTTPKTHRIAAQLIESGADHSMVHRYIYDSNDYDRLRLLGHSLLNMELLPDYNAAVIKITKKDHVRFNIKKGDTEGIVNYGLSMSNVKLSAFFREDTGIVKISFRSKDDVDVNQFARKYFNGGGHVNAAGGMSNKGLNDAIDDFKKALEEYAKDFNL